MPDPRQGENNCYLQVQDLKKTFMDRKRKVEAIKGISFSVAQGEMVGFLGPNGAEDYNHQIHPGSGKTRLRQDHCGRHRLRQESR